MNKAGFVFLLSVFLLGLFLVLETNGFADSPKIDSIVKCRDEAEELSDFNCSEGWRITGYFTPIENDYNFGEMIEIEIKNVGKMSFDKEFLKTVFNEDRGYGEGWGKTRYGWYLGNYDGKWHKANAPLDANNHPLLVNSIAVDNELIPNDSQVKIPLLPGKFGQTTFIANDVGVTIHGKQIDVYCGEGKEAIREMNFITRLREDELVNVFFKTP